ncbi:MAG TPA: hypothetical protein VHT97_03895 [Acidimicrobiales bacterium]|nr:hypothetical protein [Acidimicrobiales bacterium]
MTRNRKLLVAILVPVEVVSAVLAWRDLAGRSDGAVRGTKKFWRIVVVVNPGNSLLYWLFGRR